MMSLLEGILTKERHDESIDGDCGDGGGIGGRRVRFAFFLGEQVGSVFRES
jgi:hypothetical protein